MTNLKTKVGSLILKNPLLLASGTCGYGEVFEDFFRARKTGAIVTKGISLKPRPGNPPPRICETEAGMLNSIGLENIGVEKFMSEKLPWLRKNKVTAIVNIFGEKAGEYTALAEILDRAPGLAGLELNLSCPNVQKGGLEFGRDEKAVAEITSAVKARTSLPVWVKLSASRADPVALALAAQSAGADAVVISNTLKGMAIDLEKRRPLLAPVTGGLSGPAIKPVALAAVFEAARKLNIPVVACGGVFSGKDALEFLLAGASAVEAGTACLVNPLAALEIIEEMGNYLGRAGVKSLKEWIGKIELDR
jgi:dihydroorotate dehydrogenase (NAD+) catalytic subunit